MFRLWAAPCFLAALASANCPAEYSCCCQLDFFIPVMCECVENEPARFAIFEKDNCARADRSKVAFWMRLETPEWRKNGVCTTNTTQVTRKQLEAAEAKEKAFRDEYDKFCVKNGAQCTEGEKCYVDGRHIDGDVQEWDGSVKTKGPACVCSVPNGRSQIDGTGACVPCKAGADGYPAYVQKTTKLEPKGFRNGELACALGPNASSPAIVV